MSNPDFKKGDGAKIAIKFTEDLVGSVDGNEAAFTVEGKEYQYVGGPLLDGDYQVDEVIWHPPALYWQDDFSGEMDGVEAKDGGLRLAGSCPVANIEGLEVWFDASQITGLNNNDIVGSWQDMSGKNRHAVQNTESRKPKYIAGAFNRMPAVLFDGSGTVLDTANFPAAIPQPTTIFVVCNALTGGTRHLFDSTTANRQTVYMYNGQLSYYAGAQCFGSALAISTQAVITATFAGANSNLRKNGKVDLSANPGISAIGGIRFGCYQAGNAHWHGYIAELILYSKALSSNDRGAVEEYLANKYGITLEAS